MTEIFCDKRGEFSAVFVSIDLGQEDVLLGSLCTHRHIRVGLRTSACPLWHCLAHALQTITSNMLDEQSSHFWVASSILRKHFNSLLDNKYINICYKLTNMTNSSHFMLIEIFHAIP